MSALAPFHKALYQRLNADAGLAAYQHESMTAAGVPTFDHAPKDSAYPYIALESYNEGRVGLFSGRGFDDTAQLGVWDNFRGKERVLEIMGLITEALVDPLTVEGWGLVRAKLDLATFAPDPSGLKHGIFRTRAVVLG